MKLQTKLTLFNAVSKLVLVLLFVALLPTLIQNINQNYTDNRLRKQKEKVLQVVRSKGIRYYIDDTDQGYGSYNLLKEEYVSLDTALTLTEHLDTIRNERRIIDGDTIQYRILSHTFKLNKHNYLLEIGKSVNTIGETSGPLQNIAFEVLLGMILLTIMADVFYSNYVLRPLGQIIRTKLIGNKFPQFKQYEKVHTTTSDFEYLDVSIHRMITTIETTFQKEREFISNASHELMTPVSILQSKIENMFNEENVSDEQKIRLLEMQRILNRLKSITKTLLLISQIENEQFIREDSVQVQELLQEVYDEISIRLQQKNITLTMDVAGDIRLVNINRFLLFNLFFNLVNNAIKYNKEGGDIRISAKREKFGIEISIADTGIGISPQQLPHIFNRFKKFRQSLQQDSFGLGLPIVKSIAEFHGLGLDVNSKEGEGSTFLLHFPSALSPQ